MGRFVIVAYSPKPGMEGPLLDAVRKHLRVLRDEHLVTDRVAYAMRSSNGTIVEVFEWRSAEAIRQAHEIPAVQALWEEFGACCDYKPLATVPECEHMFAEFDPVEL